VGEDVRPITWRSCFYREAVCARLIVAVSTMHQACVWLECVRLSCATIVFQQRLELRRLAWQASFSRLDHATIYSPGGTPDWHLAA
jgi:hypothetical protein